MHIQDVFQARPTTFSFEFFPPKTDEASEELFATIAQLAGAAALVRLGDLRRGGFDARADARPDRPDPAGDAADGGLAPDLRLPQRDELAAILDRYAESGIENILALGGDPPRERCRITIARSDAFQYAEQPRPVHPSRRERVPIRAGSASASPGFPEGHPGTPNRLKEMDYLKRKVDAGADYICTQLFFNNDDFYDFRERCDLAGIRVPILAGIMPITSKEDMTRMAELALGARFPARLLRAVDRCGDDPEAVSQGRHPLGDRAVPRPARQQGPRHPLLHPEPLGRDAADLREPRRQGLRRGWSIVRSRDDPRHRDRPQAIARP